MSEELKPCPFCGSNEVEINHIVSFKGDVNHYFGSCKKCRTNMGCFKTGEEAIKAWNNRPSPWHTGTPTETGEYLIKIRYDFGKEGYTTAYYVEPFNPHRGWYNIKPVSESGSAEEWCKKNGIEVLAWQKIERYKGEAKNESNPAGILELD